MKVICDFYKKCKIPYCHHSKEHEISSHYNCTTPKRCASTSKIVNCINPILILRKEKLKKISGHQ